MDKKFEEYLRDIGLTETLRRRIGDIYTSLEELFPEKIEDIFISEYIKEDGSREFIELVLFSNNYWMDSTIAGTQDIYTICLLNGNIYHIEITKRDYDFHEATEQSRLNIEVGMHPRVVGELKASKKNCDYLSDICKKYILTNLRTKKGSEI